MKINRNELLAALKIIKPAIATRDIIEEFTNVWFTGTHLIAGNDVGFGISVPFQSEFKGGIRGSLLIGLTNNTKIKEFELEPGKENGLVLKAGRSKVELSVFPIKKMLVQVPEESDKGVAIPKEFLEGLKKVLFAVGSETRAMPEQKGVTLVKGPVFNHMFATNGATIAQYTWDDKFPVPNKSIILPSEFVDALVNNNVKTLSYGKGWAWAKGEKIFIFTKLLQNDEPKDLIKITEEASKGAVYIPIPQRLKLALARASVLLDKQKQEHIIVKVEGAVLRLKTSSALGDLKDTIALDKDVPTMEAEINPSYLQKALDKCDSMFIGKKAAVLTGKNFSYFIAYKG